MTSKSADFLECYRLASVRTVMRRKNPTPELQNGQIWRMKDANLHVEGVGKRLVHYKLFKGSAKRAPISLSGKEAVEKYLENNKAVLVSELS
jgi:hypothetical protein